MRLNPERLRLVPMLLMLGAIFFISHQPGDTVDLGMPPGSDKLAHLLVYGLLAGTMILAHSSRTRKIFPLQVCLNTTTAAVVYGILDELHQSFIPGRFVSGLDVLADAAGALLVCGAWLWWEKRRGVRTKATTGRA